MCSQSRDCQGFALEAEKPCQPFEGMTPVRCKCPPSPSQAGSLTRPEVDSSTPPALCLPRPCPHPLPPHTHTASSLVWWCPVLLLSSLLSHADPSFSPNSTHTDFHPHGRGDPAQGWLQSLAPLLSPLSPGEGPNSLPCGRTNLVDSQMVHLSWNA